MTVSEIRDTAVGPPSGRDVPALEMEDLTVTLRSRSARRPILAGVSLRVDRGETVGLVGESGSGKSVTSRAALGMFPRGAEVGGRVVVSGADVTEMSRRELGDLRSSRVAMIFQDPRSALNPVRRVDAFLVETMRQAGVDRSTAYRRAVELLASVGIRDADAVARLYPHQLSGGMLQRVMISAALAQEPALLLADEPTTALDVTTQADVVAILERRRHEAGAAMLLVTHNLELAGAVCSRLYVMYAGRIVEHGPADRVLQRPRHPYTRALLAATPRLGDPTPIRGAPGRPLSLAEAPAGCSFAMRCPDVVDACRSVVPGLEPLDDGAAACLRLAEIG